MAVTIQHKRGTAAEWAALNPVLKPGELGFEKDTKIIKLGDGVTAWNDLDLGYLRKDGGVMTGPLSLVAPTADAHAIRRVDLQAGYRYLTTVKFVLNGNFIKANYPGLRAVLARVQGAGAAGGGAAVTGASQTSAGGGGGGGSYAESFFLESELSASEPIVVGVGGNGVAGGTGGNGGSSSFKGATHALAPGGAGGGSATAQPYGNQAGRGGQGGYGVVGNRLAIEGGSGTPGVSMSFSVGGTGGSSRLGAGKSNTASNTNGQAGADYGGGGAGASNHSSQGTARTGGSGGAGVVLVDIYI